MYRESGACTVPERERARHFAVSPGDGGSVRRVAGLAEALMVRTQAACPGLRWLSSRVMLVRWGVEVSHRGPVCGYRCPNAKTSVSTTLFAAQAVVLPVLLTALWVQMSWCAARRYALSQHAGVERELRAGSLAGSRTDAAHCYTGASQSSILILPAAAATASAAAPVMSPGRQTITCLPQNHSTHATYKLSP